MLIYLNYLMEMVLSSCEHANIMKWVRLLSNRKVVLIIVSSSGAISIPGLVFLPFVFAVPCRQSKYSLHYVTRWASA